MTMYWIDIDGGIVIRHSHSLTNPNLKDKMLMGFDSNKPLPSVKKMLAMARKLYKGKLL